MKDEDLMKKVEEVSAGFTGQIDDLQAAVGLITVGRLYGWRVMRLACSRRHWTLTCSLFGDLKEILPERGVLAHKSFGLKVVDKAHDYWQVVQGHEVVIAKERKMVL
jgi:hypothetical protein